MGKKDYSKKDTKSKGITKSSTEKKEKKDKKDKGKKYKTKQDKKAEYLAKHA